MKIITLGKFERGITALWAKVKTLVSGRGRFLSLWNCSTGLATTSPSTLPYTYKTGDYFIVSAVASGSGYTHTITISGTTDIGLHSGSIEFDAAFTIQNQTSTQYQTLSDLITAVGSTEVAATGTVTITEDGTVTTHTVAKVVNDGGFVLKDADDQKLAFPKDDTTYTTTVLDTVTGSGSTNYKPTGSSYTGVASTTAETNDVAVDDTYYYDGSTWKLQNDARKTVTFANIAGQPTDNTNLAAELTKLKKLAGGAY